MTYSLQFQVPDPSDIWLLRFIVLRGLSQISRFNNYHDRLEDIHFGFEQNTVVLKLNILVYGQNSELCENFCINLCCFFLINLLWFRKCIRIQSLWQDQHNLWIYFWHSYSFCNHFQRYITHFFFMPSCNPCHRTPYNTYIG